MINVIIFLSIVAWLLIYLKYKKALFVLPYLLIVFITPFYNILDSKIFVEIFGCGCVPITQTNMFNIAFNANDLRRLIYFIISILMLLLGIKISKNFKSKRVRVIYNVSILILNLLATYQICQLYMWG